MSLVEWIEILILSLRNQTLTILFWQSNPSNTEKSQNPSQVFMCLPAILIPSNTSIQKHPQNFFKNLLVAVKYATLLII